MAIEYRVALTHEQQVLQDKAHLVQACEVIQDLLRELCFPTVRGTEAAKAKAREWMRDVRKGGAS